MKCREQTQKLNRDKLLLCYSINDFYKKYKKERKNSKYLSQKKYRAAILKLFYYTTQNIIETSKPFNPRASLGRFGIVKRKAKKKSVDFYKSKKLGKVVYFSNIHSNGYFFRWFWEKYTSKCRLKNKRYYKFTPSKTISKRLGDHIMKLNDDPYSKNYDCLSQLPIYEQS